MQQVIISSGSNEVIIGSAKGGNKLELLKKTAEKLLRKKRGRYRVRKIRKKQINYYK